MSDVRARVRAAVAVARPARGARAMHDDDRERGAAPRQAPASPRLFTPLFCLTAANMSHLSGGQLIREPLAKVRVATCFAGSSFVPLKVLLNMGDPALSFDWTDEMVAEKRGTTFGGSPMACLQEWDADRRQAAHAEKSLAVRELVRLSLRVQSTGVVAELHLDTALVAPSGSGADHERRIRRGCQATDGRADNWRGVLNNATDEHAQLLSDALCDPDFCMRFAIRRRIGSGGTVRLQWLFRTNSDVAA